MHKSTICKLKEDLQNKEKLVQSLSAIIESSNVAGLNRTIDKLKKKVQRLKHEKAKLNWSDVSKGQEETIGELHQQHADLKARYEQSQAEVTKLFKTLSKREETLYK